MSRFTMTATFASLLVVALVAPAFAGEGRTPIHAPGTTISADGRYVLTRNLFNSNSVPVITISASFVDLDLNGMVLTQAGGAVPVIAITGGPKRVRIHDGSLFGGNIGIDAPGGVNSLVVEDLLVHGPDGPGLHLGDVGVVDLRRIHVTGANGAGILWDGSNLKTGAIEENSIGFCFDGIVIGVRTEAVSIRNNRISMAGLTGGAGRGVSVESCFGTEIVGNIISSPFGEGIVLNACSGARVAGNSVVGAATNGIRLDLGSAENVVADNIVRQSGSGHGILVQGSRNQILRNALNLNAGAGIFFDGAGTPGFACGNTFGGNHARLNQGAGLPACAGGSPPDVCDATVCTLPNTSYGDNLIPGPPAN